MGYGIVGIEQGALALGVFMRGLLTISTVLSRFARQHVLHVTQTASTRALFPISACALCCNLPRSQRALLRYKLLTHNSVVVCHIQHHSTKSLRIDVLDFNRTGDKFFRIQTDR